MIAWIEKRTTMIAITLNLLAIVSMAEALRTSAYINSGWVVPRNPFALSQAGAEPKTEVNINSSLLDYRVQRTEDEIREVKSDVKELRADFSHITTMLIGSLLAVVVNLGITILTRRRRETQGSER
jgi:kynureninase